MIDHQIVLDRAVVLIEAAAKRGGIVRSGHIATQLLLEYPAFQLSLTELSKTIFHLASARKLPVEFGD
jgi:hypothetical protein